MKYEAVRVEAKAVLGWQKVRDAKYVECLLRRATVTKQDNPRERPRTATNKTIGVGFSSPLKLTSHNHMPSCWKRGTEFNVHPAGFQSRFNSSKYLSIALFCNGSVYYVSLYFGII